MTDATISRVRMCDLARRGRFRPATNHFTVNCWGVRFATRERPEASSIAAVLPSRSRAASSRPGEGELMASVIERF
jgi:hypothetical protein